ncbi:GDP-mannose 4,6-dehydratase [Polynucleobacter paneuropaeus]|nr:GDP-mannose 4,6-dehydratase [Polynucleobacter paneuropaeus]
MSKTALICGVTGQDGSYLAQLLLSKNYKVIGTSRDAEASTFSNLDKLGIKSQLTLTSMSLNDFRSVLQVITKYEPVEIYNLAGQTSVGLSFSQPVETMESISAGVLNLLEAVRFTNKKIRIYNAGSGEAFGDTGTEAANEETAFRPRSPYAVAKAAGFWQVANYREAYDLFACTGLLFNHESPLRPQRFVTQKIINGAKEISAGNMKSMVLGNLDITRDWGWAPEYVEAMWKMLQTPGADDYVIATGTSYSLEQFVEKVFAPYDLDWKKYVQVDKSFFRPLDIHISKANPAKANEKLGWQATTTLEKIIERMASSLL